MTMPELVFPFAVPDDQMEALQSFLLEVTALAEKYEREECAKVCDDLAREMTRDPMCGSEYVEGAERCAKAIRARGEK